MKPTLLIVDDDEGIQTQMKWALTDDYEVVLAQDRESARKGMRKANPDVVRILLTGYGTLESAMDAIKRSQIFEYLTKPWSDAGIKQTISRAFEHYNLVAENRRLHKMTREQNKQLNEQNEALRILMDEKDREMAFAEKIYSKILERLTAAMAFSKVPYAVRRIRTVSG